MHRKPYASVSTVATAERVEVVFGKRGGVILYFLYPCIIYISNKHILLFALKKKIFLVPRKLFCTHVANSNTVMCLVTVQVASLFERKLKEEQSPYLLFFLLL